MLVTIKQKIGVKIDGVISMKISPSGIDFIKQKEGFRNKAYQCSAKVWTIGWGSTRWFNDAQVRERDVISKEDAEKLLLRDVAKFEAQVRRLVKVNLTQPQFDALVSFTYNLGGSALQESTLLKKLNKGDYNGAAKEFDRWVHAGKKRVQGLVTRRAEERKMFEQYGGEYSYSPEPNNEPLRNRDLPLPTTMQEDIIVTDKAPLATGTKVAIGGVGAAGAIELAVQATPLINAATAFSWQTAAVVVAGLIVAGGVWYFLKSKRG